MRERGFDVSPRRRRRPPGRRENPKPAHGLGSVESGAGARALQDLPAFRTRRVKRESVLECGTQFRFGKRRCRAALQDLSAFRTRRVKRESVLECGTQFRFPREATRTFLLATSREGPIFPPCPRDLKFPRPHAPAHRLSEAGTYFVTAATYLKFHHFRGADRLRVLHRGLLKLAQEFGWQTRSVGSVLRSLSFCGPFARRAGG